MNSMMDLIDQKYLTFYFIFSGTIYSSFNVLYKDKYFFAQNKIFYRNSFVVNFSVEYITPVNFV